ncbi:MAG: class I SAM-dependent methyltransferase [Dehalococcoidia bacterium]
METEHATCDLCGADDYEIIWDKTEREKQGVLRCKVIRDTKGEIIHGRVVICKNCGLVYVNPRMTQESLDQFYAEDYRRVYNEPATLKNEANHAKNAWELLQPYIYTGKKILDIGCSTGKLVELTQGYGIEPNREHCEIAKGKGLQVENCTIEDYAPGFKFDIITMLNALEHVASPTAVLSKIYSLLNSDGYVVISVPNFGNRTIHLSVDAFLSNAHLYHFELITLKELFQKCGFKPVGECVTVESIGEKLYLLGQKTDERLEKINQAPSGYHETARKFLVQSQSVWDMKEKIKRMGFR